MEIRKMIEALEKLTKVERPHAEFVAPPMSGPYPTIQEVQAFNKAYEEWKRHNAN